MKLAVLKERRPGEARVAASPDMVKRFARLGVEVAVEAGAGADSGISDGAFAAAGAALALNPAAALTGAGAVFKVRRPTVEGEGQIDELALIPDGALLVGMIDPLGEPGQFPGLCRQAADRAGHGAGAPHRPGAIHGCAVVAGQSGRL